MHPYYLYTLDTPKVHEPHSYTRYHIIHTLSYPSHRCANLTLHSIRTMIQQKKTRNVTIYIYMVLSFASTTVDHVFSHLLHSASEIDCNYCVDFTVWFLCCFWHFQRECGIAKAMANSPRSYLWAWTGTSIKLRETSGFSAWLKKQWTDQHALGSCMLVPDIEHEQHAWPVRVGCTGMICPRKTANKKNNACWTRVLEGSK